MNPLVDERARVRVSIPGTASSLAAPATAPISRRSGDPTTSGFAGVFQAIGALQNGPALTALAGCLIAGVLLDGFFATLGGHSGVYLTFLGKLCLFVATASGLNAAGMLLLDQAKQKTTPRKLQAAIVEGLMCVPKCLVLGLALLIVGLAVVVVLACAYFICRAPLLGPKIFTVVFPASVAIAGASFCGLTLCLFLALPALWEGSSLSAAIAQALAIARRRLVESFLLMAAVGGLTLAVACVVFGALIAGLVPMLGLATGVFGADPLAGMAALLWPGYWSAGLAGDTGGADYVLAMALGGGLLLALAASLVGLVPLFGLSVVFLRVREDGAGLVASRVAPTTEVVTTPTAPALRATAPPLAPQPAARHFASAFTPLARSSDSGFALRSRCPHCLSATASDDVFCGICGYKLLS